jgi:hypothetical protein
VFVSVPQYQSASKNKRSYFCTQNRSPAMSLHALMRLHTKQRKRFRSHVDVD